MNAETGMVILRHTLAGGAHYDWMFERPGEDAEHRLVSFRSEGALPPLSASWMLNMDRTGDHRAAYLTYEGAVSGDRGEVERVASGRIASFELTREKLVVTGVVGAGGADMGLGSGFRAMFTRLPDDRWRCRWTAIDAV